MRGFISFHIATKEQYFTIYEVNYFTFCRKAKYFTEKNSRTTLSAKNISLEKRKNLYYNIIKKGGVVMADSKLRDLSTDFAVKVIKMCDGIKGHYSLVN